VSQCPSKPHASQRRAKKNKKKKKKPFESEMEKNADERTKGQEEVEETASHRYAQSAKYITPRVSVPRNQQAAFRSLYRASTL
jgi:hypothetical protein